MCGRGPCVSMCLYQNWAWPVSDVTSPVYCNRPDVNDDGELLGMSWKGHFLTKPSLSALEMLPTFSTNSAMPWNS